jgi:hypothetical protein
MIEILAEGVRIDQPAAEAVLLHGALELVRRRLRVLEGERCKATETGGVLLDHRFKEVIDLTRIGDSKPSVPLRLNAGRR